MDKVKLKPDVRLKKVKARINEVIGSLTNDFRNSASIDELQLLLIQQDEILNEGIVLRGNYLHHTKPNFVKPTILKKSEKKENLKNHITELNIKIGKKNKEAFIAREKMLYWQKISTKLLSKKELEECHKEINDLEALLNK